MLSFEFSYSALNNSSNSRWRCTARLCQLIFGPDNTGLSCNPILWQNSKHNGTILLCFPLLTPCCDTAPLTLVMAPPVLLWWHSTCYTMTLTLLADSRALILNTWLSSEKLQVCFTFCFKYIPQSFNFSALQSLNVVVCSHPQMVTVRS